MLNNVEQELHYLCIFLDHILNTNKLNSQWHSCLIKDTVVETHDSSQRAYRCNIYIM